MTDHPGIVNKTRVGSNCYGHQFVSGDMLHHLTVDRPGCVRLMLQLDTVWLQTKAGEPPDFPRSLREAPWSDAWQACADHNIDVLLTLLCKDGLAWQGNRQPSDPWWWPKHKRREWGLQWAAEALTKHDPDGGRLWFADPTTLPRFLQGLADLSDLFGVNIILDGWNEVDLRPDPFVTGNQENRHAEWATSFGNDTLFGYTGGLARWHDYVADMQQVFPGQVATGGIVWDAWREATAPNADIQSLHIYGAANVFEAGPKCLTDQMAAWDALGVDGPVMVTEISVGETAGGDGFDDQQAADHRRAIGEMQQQLGSRLTHYADHTNSPWPWESTDSHPQGFGRWWIG